MTDLASCTSCIHYNPFKEQTCKAFPKRIPKAIFTGKRKHTNVLKAQVTKFTFKSRKDPFSCKKDCVTLSEFSKSSCINCFHFNTDCNLCAAFPKGIPLDILKGKDLHLEPIKGQKSNLTFSHK